MHDEIKRFGLTGTVTSDKFVQTRGSLINETKASMREEGYVPVLDLGEQFTRQYDPQTESFTFELSIYGIYVGETECQIEGLMNGALVPKSTRQDKSRESSEH